MHTILVSILILLYLVNEKFQIQATEPSPETQSFPCGEIPDPIIPPESEPLPRSPGRFWELNKTNFETCLNIIPQDCMYRYVVTSIRIALPGQQNRVNLDEYYIKYRLDNTNRFIQLREVNRSTTTPMMVEGIGMIVEIRPLIVLEELWISRLPTSNTHTSKFHVRYEIRGFTIPRAAVLKGYLIAQPNLISDDTYTGICNGKVCYGRSGQLMDTGKTAGSMFLGWRCDETTKNCSYPLRIQLTEQVNVSDIKIYGFDSDSIRITVPEIIIIQPNIRTNSVSNVFDPDRYPILIPINRTTDEIFLSMNIPASHILSISKVEVFSNGVNIALFQIEDIESLGTTISTSTTTPSNSTTTPLTSEDSKCKDSIIILGTIFGAMLLVIIVLTILSIYLAIKYRKVKRLLVKQLPYNTVLKNLNGIPLQPTDHEQSRYRCKLPNPNEIYTTIGPECSTGNPMDSLNNGNNNKIIGTSKVGTNFSTETFSENPSGHSYLTETIETTLQTPIESCDSNCQDTDRTPNKELNLEQEGRIPGLEREELQNEVCEMRDNPLYPEVEIAHSKDDFSNYDSLKH